MRKAAYVLIALAVAAVAVVLAGCGAKVEGVPDTVATVNGEKITAADYLSQVSRTAGQQVLRNMIEQDLIVQWAKEEKVPVTDEQVEKQIALMKKTGSYEDRADAIGESGVEQQVRVEQAVTNLAKKFYKVGKSDLDSAYEMGKSNYVHGPRKRVALLIVDDKAKIEKAAKEIKDGADFDQVATQYAGGSPFGQSGPIKTWLDPEQPNLPSGLAKAVKDTKVGAVSKPFDLSSPMMQGNKSYAILKVLKTQPKADLKLADVKPEVEKYAAMQKVQAESADFQKRLNEWKRNADIQVNIDKFKEIESSFKNPPEPMAPPAMQPSATPKPAPKSAPKSEAAPKAEAGKK